MTLSRQLFFDLDHTLWDYDANAGETLLTLYENYGLISHFSTLAQFRQAFHKCNHQLWHLYNIGEIDKKEIRDNRFTYILEAKEVAAKQLARELSNFFVWECPKKTTLLPNALEVLEHLSSRYQLGIITNGFDDTQIEKLRNSNIEKYFSWVITSESIGYRKPAIQIFEFALQASNGASQKAVMIGDNLDTDILGANLAGWESIWYNPGKLSNNPSQPQIHDLLELLQIY